MYVPSNLFRKAFAYSKEHYDVVDILSAKHHLLPLDTIIEPYNETLNDKGVKEIKEWSNKVFGQMQSSLDFQTIGTVYFHAGNRYRKFLIPQLEDAGLKCEIPLEGLRIGEQLAWYRQRGF